METDDIKMLPTMEQRLDASVQDLTGVKIEFDYGVNPWITEIKDDIILVPGVNDGQLVAGVFNYSRRIDLSEFNEQGDKLAQMVTKTEAVIALSPNPEQTRRDIEIQKAGIQSPKKRYNVDIVKIVDLALKGVTDKDIAAALGLPSKQSSRFFIYEMRKRYMPVDIDLNEIKAFEHVKSYALAKKQKEIIEALTPEKLQRATVRDLASLYDTMFDKQRLLQGQSTENISMKFSGIVEEIHRRRESNAAQNNIGSDKVNAE